MIKLLIVIYNNEKKLKMNLKKYKLNYTATCYARGSASLSLLNYFGLNVVKKSIYFILISDLIETKILNELNTKLKLFEIGNGISFTIDVLSGNKFIKDSLTKGEINSMKEDNKYELIVTIVKEGYSDQVMNAAKKVGCMGGTIIEGRSLGTSRTVFMNLTLEPEKDIVINVVKNDIKDKVMKSINKEAGIKTDARGLIISLPISNVVGLQE